MSTPSTSRSSSRATLQDPPTTPDRPQMNRAGSTSVVPKSEYLRNAIQARRAQQTPTPTPGPTESRTPLQTTARPPPVKTPKISPDIFAEYALTEEQTTPVSPICRRRPSDAGMPRSRTNRELTTEIERLKDSLMTSNMRVELLKKNNSDLQHSLTTAKERVEQLEPLEQDYFELQDENELLQAKMEKMENAMAELRDENAHLCKTNEEISQLAQESASHWQDQESAVDEAVESIIRLEDEKSALANELAQLKERVAAIESHSAANTLVDGSPGRYPVRVFSVDESRPSTSHFDSDYYSQPGSPRKEPERDSIISITPSERSKKFLDESEERRRSARDIFKRMSAASLKALSIRTPTPAPEVPPIPAEFKQDATKDPFVVANKTPGRYRKARQLIPMDLLEVAAKTPSPTDTVMPQSPVMSSQGLRGLYRPDMQGRRTISDSSRPSSSHVRTPTETTMPYRPTSVVPELSPIVPSRLSSRHAHTSSSSEHLERRSLRQRRRSDSGLRSGESTPTIQLNHTNPEWAGEPSPPPPSIISESDLTTEVDPNEDRDKWWRSMNRITRVQDLSRDPSQPTLHRSPRQAMLPSAASGSVPVPAQERRTHSSHRDEISATLKYMGSGERRSSAAPSAFHQTDFLFNGAEDEDTFIRKTKAGIRR